MWILIRYLASRAGFYSPWWEYQHMAIRHNSRPQSGYLFSAQHYLTNNYSVYSIKLWNSHKWPQHPSVGLKHYSTLYNSVSWIQRTQRRAHTHTPGALMQRERKDKVMESRNIIKSELFHPFYSKAEENRLVAGGADAHSNPGWKDTVFSLLKKKNCFYKVTWVYKEKVTACWQSNMDYSLEACQSPKMLPPKRQLLKIQWIKAFFPCCCSN